MSLDRLDREHLQSRSLDGMLEGVKSFRRPALHLDASGR